MIVDDEKELYEAAWKISSYCSGGICRQCIFYGGGIDCRINNVPMVWDLPEDPNP